MFDKILEAADKLVSPNDENIVLNYYSKGAYPFISYNNKFYIGKEKETHTDLIRSKLFKQDNIEYDDILRIFDEFNYSGRIWLYDNVISTWEELRKDVIKDIIKKLEKHFKIEIDYDKWFYHFNDMNDKYYTVYISDYFDNNIEYGEVSDVNFDKLPPELLRRIHIMNSEEKSKFKNKSNFNNYGSYLTSWDSKNNLKKRQKLYQESFTNDIYDLNLSKDKEKMFDKMITNDFIFLYKDDVLYNPIGEEGKCELNVYNLIKKYPDRYYPVAGYMIQERSSFVEHWWVFDKEYKKHVEITPLYGNGENWLTGYIGIINKDINNEIVESPKFDYAPEFLKGDYIYFKYLKENMIINFKDYLEYLK